MLPGFEEQLIGLHSGADIKVTIPAAEAFGLAIPGNIHRISRSRFRQLLDGEYEDLQSGDVISFKDPAGYDLPAVVKEKYTDAAVMDFNHPLAGKDIVFRAKVIKVEDGDSQFTEVKL